MKNEKREKENRKRKRKKKSFGKKTAKGGAVRVLAALRRFALNTQTQRQRRLS